MTDALKQLIPPGHVARFYDEDGETKVEFLRFLTPANAKQRRERKDRQC